MGVRSWLFSAAAPPGAPAVTDEQRYSFSDWLNEVASYTFNGNHYLLPMTQPPGGGETIDNDFLSYVARIYKRSSPVFAVIQARINLLSEAPFCFRDLRTHKLFTTADLAILEEPWPNGSTGELWARMEQDGSLAGGFYAYRDGNRIRRLSPEKVTIALGSSAEYAADVTDLNSEIIGYVYFPDGYAKANIGDGIPLTVSEVVHWSPIPDPSAKFRGMSWVTAAVREVLSDSAATDAKQRFFDNAMTPNLVIKLPPEVTTQKQFDEFRDRIEQSHGGNLNAYKSLYLAAGADVAAVGVDVKTAGLRDIQGGDETRICAAGRVPPVIVGLSEGLQSATYSNYNQARRQFADGWARPTWRSACSALAKLVNVPPGCELWYDDRSIAFLRDDAKEAAETITANVAAIVQAVNGGFTASSAVAAVTTGDLSLLEHTDLVSVQLQPPGQTPALSAGSSNGATVANGPASN